MHPTKRIQLEEGFSPVVDSPELMRPRDKVKRLQRMAEFGCFEHNDRVRGLEEVFSESGATVFKIHWKERPDGTPLKPTFMEYSELKYKAPYKIIEWFESKARNLLPQGLAQEHPHQHEYFPIQKESELNEDKQVQEQSQSQQQQQSQTINQKQDQQKDYELLQEPQPQLSEMKETEVMNHEVRNTVEPQGSIPDPLMQQSPKNTIQEELFVPSRHIPCTPPQEDFPTFLPVQTEIIPQPEDIEIHPADLQAMDPPRQQSPEIVHPQVPMIIVESEPLIVQAPPPQDTFYSIQIDDDNQPVQVTPPPPNKVRRRKAVMPQHQAKPVCIDIINLSDEEFNVATPHHRIPSPKLEEKTHLQELLSISEAMIKDNNSSGSKGFISRLFGR